MRALLVSAEARQDMVAATDWYESARPGLGAAFIVALAQARARIEANPFAFQIISRSIRRAGLRRFPYGLFFIVEDARIVIIACLHSSRSPAVWQGRE